MAESKKIDAANKKNTKRIDILKIIEDEKIEIFFQPIVSTYQGRVAGLEALARSFMADGTLISPLDLFEAAQLEDCVLALDQLCQKKAMQTFVERFGKDSSIMLFMNVDNSVIHLHDDLIHQYTLQCGMKPQNIVLEINELQSADDHGMNDVIQFTNAYREKGYKICIDDIGSGFSNLDRVIALEPDVIKIDRQLIQNIHMEFLKQQVVDIIVKLADRTGALIVAEGVEELDEVLTVLKLGVQLLQGFYISRPQPFNQETIDILNPIIKGVSLKQNEYFTEFLCERCEVNEHYRIRFLQIKEKVDACKSESIENMIQMILEKDHSIECGYVINRDGIQITNTIFREFSMQRLSKENMLFKPNVAGDDAKLKAYYYVLKTTNQNIYISEPYLSLATGSKCITISGYIGKTDRCILCLDVLL